MELNQPNQKIELFYQQVQQVQQPRQPRQNQQLENVEFNKPQQLQQFNFNIETEEHKKALQNKIKSFFSEELGEEEELLLAKKEEQRTALTKDTLLKFLNQEIKAEADAEEKPYHNFLTEFIAKQENKDFAVEFLANQENQGFAVEFLATKHEATNLLLNTSSQDINQGQNERNNNEIALDRELNNNNETYPIKDFIKTNLKNFSSKLFEAEVQGDETTKLLKNIIEIQGINTTNITCNQNNEGDKNRFKELFLEIFNRNENDQNVNEIIKTNLALFTEDLLKIKDFKKLELFKKANENKDVISKITNAIKNEDPNEEEKKNQKINATKIALNNHLVLAEVLKENNIADKIKITGNTKLNEETIYKLSELTKYNDTKADAQSLISKNLKSIVRNDTYSINKDGTIYNEITTRLNQYNKIDSFFTRSKANIKEEKVLLADDDKKFLKEQKTLINNIKEVTKLENIEDLKKSVTNRLENDSYKKRGKVDQNNIKQVSAIKTAINIAAKKEEALQAQQNIDYTTTIKSSIAIATGILKASGTQKDDRKINSGVFNEAVLDLCRDKVTSLGYQRNNNGTYTKIKNDNKSGILKTFKANLEKEFSANETLHGKKLKFIEFIGYKEPGELIKLKKDNWINNNKVNNLIKEIKKDFGWQIKFEKNDIKLDFTKPKENSKIRKAFIEDAQKILKTITEDKNQAHVKESKDMKTDLQVKKLQTDKKWVEAVNNISNNNKSR